MTFKRGTGRRILLAVAIGAVGSVAVASAASGQHRAAPIKLAILSDCKGAFASFFDADIGGAQAAFAKYAGGKAKNPKKASAGMTGIKLGGRPVKIVGYGCSDDTAATAVKETKRLMEGLKADILIGPLSGDEGIAVANYAKKHPKQTFINGTSAAQDTTLQVKAPNFFRFNSDGAQWSAGLGDYAKNTLGWKTAGVISDDYSFAWTSTGGMIADFCGAGGTIDPANRFYPPLNEPSYDQWAQKMLSAKVDGFFVGVGGKGLTSLLAAYKAQGGKIDGKKFAGNVFWGDPIQFKELGQDIAGAVFGGPTYGDSTSAKAKAYSATIAKVYPSLKGSEASVFVYNYYNAAWALVMAANATKGDISGAKLWPALAKVKVPGAYGDVTLDKNRNGIADNYVSEVQKAGDGLAVKTILRIPKVTQAFGGVFDGSKSPGRDFPTCKTASLPWVGKAQPVG